MKLSKELLNAVNELEIRSRRNVAALLAGNYRSSFRGSGMQFKEFRQYEPGDDIRHMSWQVTARTGHPTLKVFEEERELNVILLVDVSGSSLFGYGKKRKLDMYSELVALMGLAAVKSGDNVGILLFNDSPVSYIPPKRTRDHVLVGLTHLLETPLLGKKSNLSTAMRYIGSTVKTRSLIIVLSDFLVPTFDQEMQMLSKKHEIILLQCYDDAEKMFGINGVYETLDPETGELLLLDANSSHTKKLIAGFYTELQNNLESSARNAQADYLPLSINDDYLQRLVHFFHRRGSSRL